ncbi:ComEC/Rec2 family competence protein [Nonomuraea sp. NPDC050783]|uniref:ComEC/Rec2 family competence protein n=1 Tax=Nonomuraea sp. NPDC050783 TaxID=3154634 RepID=UPI003466A2DF
MPTNTAASTGTYASTAAHEPGGAHESGGAHEADSGLEPRHAWPLMLPALATWAGTLTLLTCSATLGMIITAGALLAASGFAWHTRLPASSPRTGTPAGACAWRNTVIATLISVAAASASVALRVHALTTGPVAGLASRNASVTARMTIDDDPRRRAQQHRQDSYVVPATLSILQTPSAPSGRLAVDVPVTVFADGGDWSTLLPSQQVEVTGRLARPTPGDLVAAVLLVRGPPRVLTRPSPLQTVAGSLRSGLRSAAATLPPDQRGLLPGLVVGDVSRMDPQVSSDLKETGLSHLNAVSGANLAIVAGAALALSRLVGLSLPMRAGFAALAMLGFAVVARPSPSVLRALLMGLAACVALATGRAKDGLAALSATVLLLTLFAPQLARSYGFALSVAATAGILLLAPRWCDRWSNAKDKDTTRNGSRNPAQDDAADHDAKEDEGRGGAGRGDGGRDAVGRGDGGRGGGTCLGGEAGARGRPIARGRRLLLPRWLAEAVAVPAAAQVAVTPVLVLMSGQVTPVALLANLLVAPAVAPATLLGFGAALIAPLWPDAAALLVVPAGYAVGWIIVVAGWAVDLPFATVPWPGGLAGLALLAVTAVVAVAVSRRRAWRAWALTVAAAALVSVLIVRPLVGPWPPKGWLMVMCDVGQGDGMVIAAGARRGVVVDAGPDPLVMDKCLRRLGIDDIPLLVLTHPHADHVNGLPGVLRERRVGAVLVSPQRTNPRMSAYLSADLARRRVPEWGAVPGSRWRFGPSEVTVIAPEPGGTGMRGQGEGSVINNSSVVLYVRWRAGSMLFGGDLEIEAQDELLRRFPVQADIIKTPHHGSPRQSPAFLASLRARAALISVGAGNDYGHPAPSTLALLRSLGVTSYRTDRSGDLAVVEHDGGLAVVARGSGSGSDSDSDSDSGVDAGASAEVGMGADTEGDGDGTE